MFARGDSTELKRAVREALPDLKIHLTGIRKEFSAHGQVLSVLEEVDFRAAKGELVSIIGPSGCGKSTLLNIIAGLEEPTQGTVEIRGLEGVSRLGHVAHMHQKDLLLPWRTVLENATLGLEVQGVSRRRAQARALALTEQFGLKGFEGMYPFFLSGGMRQRVAFLRTVLSEMEVVLLDEPFGALDALTRTQMQEWLLYLWSTFRKTIVLVTHDVDEAVFVSDRIYVMTARPGRVKMIMPVDLPRPRSYEVVTQEPFVALKARLIAAIREESLRASETPWR